MTCPLCRGEDCHYHRLRLAGTWHPPLAQRQDGLPDDYLTPIWRLRPDRPGIAVLGLDAREAVYVLANGCTLDGLTYRASLEGCDGRVQGDGRVMVRITPTELPEQGFVDCAQAGR